MVFLGVILSFRADKDIARRVAGVTLFLAGAIGREWPSPGFGNGPVLGIPSKEPKSVGWFSSGSFPHSLLRTMKSMINTNQQTFTGR